MTLNNTELPLLTRDDLGDVTLLHRGTNLCRQSADVQSGITPLVMLLHVLERVRVAYRVTYRLTRIEARLAQSANVARLELLRVINVLA